MKSQEPCVRTDRCLDHFLVRSRIANFGGIGRCRLNVYSAPALLVKGETYGILDRILGPDVDIEAVLNGFEGAPQYDVFEILRV